MAFRLEHRIPPPVVGACTAGLMLGVARLPVAVATGALGILIDLAGLSKASALVTGGVYRWTRNPMYLGMAALLLAWGFWLANAGALAVISLFIAYLNRFQIAPEERALEARFGDEFTAYRARVRRWI